MGTWVRPTGHIDPSGGWTTETYAYNGNTSNGAYGGTPAWSWSTFLELTISPIVCDKIKYYLQTPNPVEVNQIDVDVYYSGSYHHIYQGAFSNSAWTEKSLGGTYTVSKMRFRFYNNSASVPYYGQVNAAEFNDTFTPAAPTNCAATDGVYTDKVVITWTKSAGATAYQVYRNGVGLGWLGNVATMNYTGAAPTITPGNATASDGTSAAHVSLSLSGQSVANGTTYTYKVIAKYLSSVSPFSNTNTGYRSVGSLTYQWQRSSADSAADYSNIDGATTASYNDTGAPSNGDGRYFRCVENATGAGQQISSVNRGYRAAAPTVTTQAVSDVAPTTLTGNGNITDIGSENATRRGFCYMEGTSGDPTTSDSVAYDDGSFGTGAYTKGIIGLSASTNYRVRAYAVNTGGTSYGSTVQATTGDIPTVTVTTQAVSNIGITTAIGHGNITFGVATIRGICWNTTGNPTVADYKSEEVGSFGTGAFTSPMTSLGEEQEYYVRAYAYDDNGYSYGSQVEFTTYATFSVRGFEVRLAFTGTLNEYIDHEIAGFSTGTASYNANTSKWEGTITKTVIEIGSFSEGAFTGDLGRFPVAVASDKLFAGETYDYRAYVIIYGITFYGNYVEFTTNTHPADYILDDMSDGNFIVPIIPIEFYYKKPYTKKDVSELRKKCIIFNENSVGLALVLRHNMNVLREFFNMTTDYIDEFNRYKDVIPTQHLKELYLESLELNDFKDIVNSFIVNSADNNMNVNHNFNLIQEGLSDYETGSDDAYFRGINSNVKSVIEDNPDVDRLENKINELNNESTTNFTTIMHNLKIIRARLL